MFSGIKKKAAATAALAKAELAKRTGVEDKAELAAPEVPSPTTSSGRRALPPTTGPADGKEDCDDTAARSFGSRLGTGLGKVKDGIVKAGASATSHTPR
jgi:hypothetical protein